MILIRLLQFAGDIVYFNSCIADCVLPPAGRNHSPHIFSCSAIGKIFAVHHDTGVAVGLDDSVCTECTFPQYINSQNVTDCPQNFPTNYAQIVDDATHQVHAAGL